MGQTQTPVLQQQQQIAISRVAEERADVVDTLVGQREVPLAEET